MTKMLDRDNLIKWLKEEDSDKVSELYREAFNVKLATIGPEVYLRGLIEISNRCRKNCLYCGIRASNQHPVRYEIGEEDVIRSAQFALDAGYGSIVIQGGERRDRQFIDKISKLLEKIVSMRPKDGSQMRLGVTLSLGEQPLSVYKEWFNAGAHRYLLRIESSTKELYEKIHPKDSLHRFEDRIEALHSLREAGYQVGTGVMIGLPFQNEEHLADDLLFFKSLDIDMCGMGPYLEHSETPLYQYRDLLPDMKRRFELSLRMVALLRLMMNDINIAATTAMQAIDPLGREKAIMAGANVMMPNLTLAQVREEYSIYQNKPGVGEDAEISSSLIEGRLKNMNLPIGYNRWGDSIHFSKRKER